MLLGGVPDMLSCSKPRRGAMQLYLSHMLVGSAIVQICVVVLTLAVTSCREKREQAFLQLTCPNVSWKPLRIGNQQFVIRVLNRGLAPGRILGMKKSCGARICVSPDCGKQILIPPGESVDFGCILCIRQVGWFEHELVLYLHDQSSIREARYTLRGFALPVEG